MPDEPERPVSTKRWGYMAGTVFRPLPKSSLENTGKTPPFYVELPDGRVRYIVEEPEST